MFSVPKMTSTTVFFVPVQQNSVHEFTVLSALNLESVQAVQALVYTSSATENKPCTNSTRIGNYLKDTLHLQFQ